MSNFFNKKKNNYNHYYVCKIKIKIPIFITI